MTAEKQTINLLHIDDDKIYQKKIEHYLESATNIAFKTEQAGCLDIALKILIRQHFDVIMFELDLPDSKGVETLLSIRNAAPFSALVICTDHDDISLFQKTLESGMQHYLVKTDFTPNALIRSLCQACIHNRHIIELNTFLENVDESFAIVRLSNGEDLTFVYSTKMFDRFFAIDKSAAQEIRFHENILKECNTRRFVSHCRKALVKNRPVGFEFSMPWLDREKYFEFTFTYLSEMSSTEPHFSIRINDLTRVKRLEKALRSSRQQYHDIVEKQTDIICRLHPDGSIIFANKAFCLFFDKKKSTVQGSSFYDYIHKDDRDKLTSDLTDTETVIDAGTNYRLSNIRMIHHDGQVRWIQMTLQTTFDSYGNISEHLAVGRDTTEIEMLEAAKEKNLFLYHNIVNETPFLISRFTPDGAITFANDLFCKRFHKERKAIKGTSFFSFFSEGDHQMLLYRLTLLNSDNNSTVCTTPLSDDVQSLIKWTITAILDKNDTILELQSIGEDVTDDFRTVQEEASNHERLAREEKLITLGTLVSSITHEINNPVNFLLLNTPILKSTWHGIAPLLDKHFNETGDFMAGKFPYSKIRDNIGLMFDDMDEGLERIRTIINELKEYTKIMPPELRTLIDINHSIKTAVRIIHKYVTKATSNFKTDYGINLPPLMGNSQKLQQAVINLLLNACQALEDRSKSIHLQTLFDSKKSSILIRITDEGCGIPDENMPLLCKRFFSTKEDSGGTGLGLFITSAIVADHKGTLSFESVVGSGTTATVSIPVEKELQSNE